MCAIGRAIYGRNNSNNNNNNYCWTSCCASNYSSTSIRQPSWSATTTSREAPGATMRWMLPDTTKMTKDCKATYTQQQRQQRRTKASDQSIDHSTKTTRDAATADRETTPRTREQHAQRAPSILGDARHQGSHALYS